MRRCLKSGNMLAFSLGLLTSLLLPQSWLVIISAVLLAVISFVCSRRCRC